MYDKKSIENVDASRTSLRRVSYFYFAGTRLVYVLMYSYYALKYGTLGVLVGLIVKIITGDLNL